MTSASLHAPPAPLRGISSMATRALLAELAHAAARRGLATAQIESVGGVDAARRVQAGEAFDLVFLAADAIEPLLAAGHLQAGSRVDLVRSSVAAAVASGASVPEIGSEDALRAAVVAAPTIGFSTGPSGTALLRLFERWGLKAQLAERLRQAPAGVPVARLVATGEVALGFQQRSELLGAEGIQLVGDLPAAVAITTVFSVGLGAGTVQGDAARALLAFFNSPEAVAVKRRHGMEPA